MKSNIKNYIYIVFITFLIATIILIDLLVVVNITITCVETNISLNDLLSEIGGKYRGANYTKGAGLISVLVIQLPLLYFLINEIRKTKIDEK